MRLNEEAGRDSQLIRSGVLARVARELSIDAFDCLKWY